VADQNLFWSAFLFAGDLSIEVTGIMKPVWILLVLASLLIAGCGGDNSPVNEGRDKPKHAKKDK